MDPKFNFPFQPYPIQEKFMRELYFTIEDGNLGIFESPTGTGKSLSISCGALQWLKDSEERILRDLENEIAKLNLSTAQNSSTDDWLQEEYEKIKKNQELLALKSKLDKIKKRCEMFQELKVQVNKSKTSTNSTNKTMQFYFQKADKSKKDTLLEEKDIFPDECEGDDGDLILEECAEKEESDDEEPLQEQPENTTKIYISSRTHSQLSQFVGEIKRTVFKDDVRLVTLASRQHYCINFEVAKLKNINLINERCLDLQKSKSKSTAIGDDGKVVKKSKTKSCSACPFYNQSNIAQLKDRILVDIMDMEDLVKCGKELKACPYYASRMALDDAKVVLVSHTGIVSSGARSGVSLTLHNNILILDEAHGLTAALENAHSAPVSTKQLGTVKTFLQFYINKYRARLSSKNLLSLNQISFVVTKLLGLINPKPTEEKQENTTIFTLEDFVIKAEIDHLNLRPLVEFCRTSRLAPKLHGFSMRYSQQALEEEATKTKVNKKSAFESFLKNISKKKVDDVEETKLATKQEVHVSINLISYLYKHYCHRHEAVTSAIEAGKTRVIIYPQQPSEPTAGSALYATLEFLERLCDRSGNGRVLAQTGQGGLLKYLLLNPAEHFSDVVQQCRSVIVAGGTMEPISEFQGLLTAKNSSKSVNVVRCDHVVAPENVLAVCLSTGPGNVKLNFSFENRKSSELLNEVGRILRNVCSIVPGGVVCFLPSYTFEDTVFEHLKRNNVIEAISKKKTVFREPKSAADVDQVLSKFATAARGSGALLLSVVGGKLSEGLNFSDELGRCVIVIGMPYPNTQSPELKEKIAYLNRVGGAGGSYCETLCMKSVNQCIGRAVRHANDYACVLLVDERYSRPHTISALPSFVQASLMSHCNFGQTMGSIAKFFAKHKKKQL